jgi:hypothetical protein
MNFDMNSKMDKEKSKRGRKPSTNPKRHRLMIRLNSEENKQLLQQFERLGMPSISAHIADIALNRPIKIIEINQSAIDFVILLTSFFAQFRAIANNFNQIYKPLAMKFGEQRAREMMQIIIPATIEFKSLKKEIEQKIAKLRTKILN